MRSAWEPVAGPSFALSFAVPVAVPFALSLRSRSRSRSRSRLRSRSQVAATTPDLATAFFLIGAACGTEFRIPCLKTITT